MLEAMWTLRFRTNAGEGAGVMVLETGRIFGGDSGFSFIGTYDLQEGFTANVHVSRHWDKIPNLLGSNDFDLVLKGMPANDRWSLVGTLKGHGQPAIWVEASRKAELP